MADQILRGYRGRYLEGTAPGPGRPKGGLRRIARGLPDSHVNKRWRALRRAQRDMRAGDAMVRTAGAIAVLQAALRAGVRCERSPAAVRDRVVELPLWDGPAPVQYAPVVAPDL